jgi:exodeoxyribonuclease V alpha subunit
VNVNPATINRVASARSLTGEQTAAIRNAIAKPVSVLTAPAGCGKSFTMSALMEVLEAEGIAYQAMAPTGRAAKVLTNMVSSVSHGSAKCTTLHVGFGIRPADDTERLVDDTERDLNDFASKGNGLNEHTKVLIIDECSMVDARMMSFVLRNARDVNIVLVGDPSQLPPVSPGRPFHDICDYGLAPITRLTKVFRQADGSPVIDAATKVREGENPVGTKGVPFYEASPGDDPLPHPVDETVGIVKELLKSGMKPVDILVCSPSRKAGSGVQNLNHALRPVMNPKYRFVGEAKRGQRGETWPQVGDRVMQISNDYEKEVMNGSTGDVVESDYEHVTVVFDEDRDRRGMAKRRVEYKPDEVHSKLSLAFATTIHKAQGSQAKACITVICMDNWFMLERSLLYTAVTRAQEKLYMVGTFDAYQKACRTDTSRHARTSLAELYAAQDALGTVNA